MHRTLALTFTLCLALGCSSQSTTPSTDAAPADGNAPDATASDSAPADRPAGNDGGACADLSGAWTLDSTCSMIGLGGLEGIACLQQTGCNVRVSLMDYAGEGTVTGDTITFPYEEMRVPYRCTGQLRDGRLQVQCMRTSGSFQCTFSGTRTTVEGATRLCCNLSMPSCESGRRCAIITVSEGVQTTGCVPAGTLAEGAMCTQRDGLLGFDDCGGVTQCSTLGVPAGSATCRRPCSRDADCGDGNLCHLTPTAPTSGFCRRRCTAFGTDCPMGTACRFESQRRVPTAEPTLVSVCSQVGAAGTGARCTTSADCMAGMGCIRMGGFGACRVLCDRTHPCASGGCTPVLEGDPQGRGFCS